MSEKNNVIKAITEIKIPIPKGCLVSFIPVYKAKRAKLALELHPKSLDELQTELQRLREKQELWGCADRIYDELRSCQNFQSFVGMLEDWVGKLKSEKVQSEMERDLLKTISDDPVNRGSAAER